jgi:hypothetical protein
MAHIFTGHPKQNMNTRRLNIGINYGHAPAFGG